MIRRGLKEKLEIFCWSSSTKNPTRLVADARATFADWVDCTRALPCVADERDLPVRLRKRNKKAARAGRDSNSRLCAKVCANVRANQYACDSLHDRYLYAYYLKDLAYRFATKSNRSRLLSIQRLLRLAALGRRIYASAAAPWTASAF